MIELNRKYLKEEIVLLKHRLYGSLLELSHKFWTDSEVNIAYELSKDKDIQNTIKQNIGKKKIK